MMLTYLPVSFTLCLDRILQARDRTSNIRHDISGTDSRPADLELPPYVDGQTWLYASNPILPYP